MSSTERVRRNILLTGAPSSGKTTVVREIIRGLKVPVKGFYTEEERREGRRVGFLMTTIDGKRGYLAHQDIASPFHVRRYGVSTENIENIAVPSIEPEEGNVIVLDEIGKMECFSPIFQKAALEALDSPSIVVGTITFGGDDFILGVKKREDTEIIEVTPENRNSLPGQVLKKVAELLGNGAESR